MDLTTSYLGFSLPHPFMCGASPLAKDLDSVKRLEDAGASAIIMHSLFEEQVAYEQMGAHRISEAFANANPEARSFFTNMEVFALGPDEYLNHLRRIRETVSVPVIGSLNGTTAGGWLEYARRMEEAGASALELNLYMLSTNADVDGGSVESRSVDIVRIVRKAVTIPVAVKLSPFYSSLPHFAKRLEDVGADGIVLFNRFYQADIDVEALDLTRSLHLSDSSELLLRLRWLAVLSAQRKVSLAVSGGVHSELDAVKALMSGAHVVQMVSALLQRGPQHLRVVREGLVRWLEAHEYESLKQLRGSMDLSRCPDPGAYERANYVQLLQSWKAASAPG